MLQKLKTGEKKKKTGLTIEQNVRREVYKTASLNQQPSHKV